MCETALVQEGGRLLDEPATKLVPRERIVAVQKRQVRRDDVWGVGDDEVELGAPKGLEQVAAPNVDRNPVEPGVQPGAEDRPTREVDPGRRPGAGQDRAHRQGARAGA